MSWTEFSPEDPKQGPAYRRALSLACELYAQLKGQLEGVEA
jgi:hypothetical protein